MITQKNKTNTWILIVLGFAILFMTNLLFNAWISEGNRVFYGDDLSAVTSYMQAENWLEYSFSLSAQKLRPVAMSVIYFILKILWQNFELIDEFLLVLNFLNAVLVFSFTYWMIKSENHIVKVSLALVSGILFLASRFAYYNISEVFGIMEGLGILLAVGIQFALMLFLYDEKGQKYLGLAVVLYAAVLYTHERYFILIILFIFAVFLKNGFKAKNIRLLLLPFLLVVSFWGIRYILFGNRMMDGTGGTDIKQTFDILTAVKFCFSQIGYILGFQCGPQYLNGISSDNVSWHINILLLIRLVVIIFVFALFLRLLIVDKTFFREHIKPFSMSMLFIVLCIISSSITIRVEMRWIYVSYAMFSILFVYMAHAVYSRHPRQNIMLLLGTIFLTLTIVVEQYYREHYRNIYYWDGKDLSREFYNETLQKYGNALDGKEIIIISSVPAFVERDDQTWKAFFSPYIDINDIHITYVKNTFQAQKIRTANSIVLVEDRYERTYTNITSLLSSYFDIIYGIYEDFWCEPDCKLEIYGNADGKTSLTFYYPEDLSVVGTPNGKIIINNEQEIDYELAGCLTTVEIPLISGQVNSVQIMFNYWVCENTGRSEDGRLSSVLILPDTF